MEASYRGQGDVRSAEIFKAETVEIEQRLPDTWWLWLKALVIDEP